MKARYPGSSLVGNTSRFPTLCGLERDVGWRTFIYVGRNGSVTAMRDRKLTTRSGHFLVAHVDFKAAPSSKASQSSNGLDR